MKHLIDKTAVVAEINRVLNSYGSNEITSGRYVLCDLRDFIDTLEVKDPYEQCIQYDSIKEGIQAHAETYSFNIESKLFNQLTKEQQELWRKEIEQACISGGEAGVELARDTRYKENIEVKKAEEKFERPNINVNDAEEVSSRMKYIDDDLKPIANFILDYASWNLHKDEWSAPTLEVPLFRVLDALMQRGQNYCEG